MLCMLAAAVFLLVGEALYVEVYSYAAITFTTPVLLILVIFELLKTLFQDDTALSRRNELIVLGLVTVLSFWLEAVTAVIVCASLMECVYCLVKFRRDEHVFLTPFAVSVLGLLAMFRGRGGETAVNGAMEMIIDKALPIFQSVLG